MLRERTHRAAIALVLLAAVAAGTGALPHDPGSDDVECRNVLLAHDESAHYIGAARTATHDDADHCYLCHSFRSVHPADDRFDDRREGRDSVRLHIVQAGVAGRLEWSLLPGRAPPA